MSGGAGLTAQQTIENEQVKLLATALNTAATSSFTLGVLAPVVAAFYGAGAPTIGIHTLVLGAVVWGFCALVLHSAAGNVLETLQA